MTLRPATTYGAMVGSALLERRLELGIEQAMVASAAGVSQSTWSRIERGVSPCTIEQLRTASDMLQSTPSALIARADEMRRKVEGHGVLVRETRSVLRMGAGWIDVGVAAVREIVRE